MTSRFSLLLLLPFSAGAGFPRRPARAWRIAPRNANESSGGAAVAAIGAPSERKEDEGNKPPPAKQSASAISDRS